MTLRVGLVGCGYAGAKRASALAGCTLVAAADTDRSRAERVAAGARGARATSDWADVVDDAAIDAVIVATTPDAHARVALAAIGSGKHVLVEKPCGRTAAEPARIAEAARRNGVVAQAGFSLRFHPALRAAHALLRSGGLGPAMFVRASYGHGGRVGYGGEWRFRREVSGGGELIDQGVHLIDLARWFLGDFDEVHGYAPTYYWGGTVEDNAFLLLRTQAGDVASLHASWTEWKNRFSFEIFGRDGVAHAEGLGGSYGQERLTHHRMLPEMGPPETTIVDYPDSDVSWRAEIDEFVGSIVGGREASPGMNDAVQALEVVERVYKVAR